MTTLFEILSRHDRPCGLDELRLEFEQGEHAYSFPASLLSLKRNGIVIEKDDTVVLTEKAKQMAAYHIYRAQNAKRKNRR